MFLQYCCVTTGAKIKLARDYVRPSLSQEQLAALVDMSRATIAKWETDKIVPRKDQIKPLADKLGIDPFWFFDQDQEALPEPVIEPVKSPLTKGFAVKIAVRSWVGAMAGNPEDEIEFVPDDVNHEVPTAFLVGGIERAEHHDIVRVRGFSLAPRIHSGELVLFHRDDTPRRNTIVLAENENHQVYVKALRYDTGSGRYQLHSISSNGATFTDLTGWKIIGYAVVIMGGHESGERNIEWNDGAPLKI